MEEKKIILIDGHSILNRAFYGVPELTNSKGLHTNAVFGFLNIDVYKRQLWDRKYHTAPDLVIIEGPKAGGHLGFRMEELENMGEINYDLEIVNIIEYVRSVEKKYGKKIPVVVAGGIYDRKDMKKALLLGADGVQAATRFVTTRECDAAKEYKDAYIRAGKEDIILVKSPVGMPGRAIRNQFIGKISEKKQGVEKCYQMCIRDRNLTER